MPPWTAPWTTLLVISASLGFVSLEDREHVCLTKKAETVVVGNQSMLFVKSLEVTCHVIANDTLENVCDTRDSNDAYPHSINVKNCSESSIESILGDNFNSILSLNLSHSGLVTVQPHMLEYKYKLLLLDLSFNSIVNIPAAAFSDLTRLKYLLLQHNRLRALDLSRINPIQSRLTHLDLSHNLMTMIDVGAGVFSHLQTLNLSCNNISSFNLNSDLRLNFDNLRMLDVSHNHISGTLFKADIDVFHKNIPFTVDLSYNNISRIDLRDTLEP